MDSESESSRLEKEPFSEKEGLGNVEGEVLGGGVRLSSSGSVSVRKKVVGIVDDMVGKLRVSVIKRDLGGKVDKHKARGGDN